MADVAEKIEEKLNYTVDVCRLKKTGKIVYALGKEGNGYTCVLYPFGRQAKSGNYGHVMTVRNDNLVFERDKK